MTDLAQGSGSNSRTGTPLRSSRGTTPPTSTNPRPTSGTTRPPSSGAGTTASPRPTSSGTSVGSTTPTPKKPSAPRTTAPITPSPHKPSIRKSVGVVGTATGTPTPTTVTPAKPRTKPATSTGKTSSKKTSNTSKSIITSSTPSKKLSITTSKKEDDEDSEDEQKLVQSSDSEDEEEVKVPLSPSKKTAIDILGRSPAHQFAVDNKYLSESDLDALPELSLEQKTAPSKQRRHASSSTNEPSSFELKWDPVYKHRQTFTLHEAAGDFEPLEIFSLCYSPDGKYLAAGCSDGAIRVLNHAGRVAYMLRVPTVESLPTTTIKFRPLHSSAKTKNVLVAGNADGSVSHWHVSSQTCLYSITEEDNQIYTIDFNHDGEKFVTAGRDNKVRLYEEATKSLVATLHSGQSRDTTGHSNRVYAARWHPKDVDVVITGGWDNTIQIWDTRIGMSVRSIYGPHLCGESLDITHTGDTIVTGSWIPEHALQQWDYGTGKLINSMDWNGGRVPSNESTPPQMLYTASYSPNRSEWICGAGSGTNDARLFHTRTGNLIDVMNMGKPVYTHAFAPDGTKMCIAGGHNQIIQVEFRQ